MAETSTGNPVKRKTRGPGRPKTAATSSTVSSGGSRKNVQLTLSREAATEVYLTLGEMLIGIGGQQQGSQDSST